MSCLVSRQTTHVKSQITGSRVVKTSFSANSKGTIQFLVKFYVGSTSDILNLNKIQILSHFLNSAQNTPGWPTHDICWVCLCSSEWFCHEHDFLADISFLAWFQVKPRLYTSKGRGRGCSEHLFPQILLCPLSKTKVTTMHAWIQGWGGSPLKYVWRPPPSDLGTHSEFCASL